MTRSRRWLMVPFAACCAALLCGTAFSQPPATAPKTDGKDKSAPKALTEEAKAIAELKQGLANALKKLEEADQEIKAAKAEAAETKAAADAGMKGLKADLEAAMAAAQAAKGEAAVAKQALDEVKATAKQALDEVKAMPPPAPAAPPAEPAAPPAEPAPTVTIEEFNKVKVEVFGEEDKSLVAAAQSSGDIAWMLAASAFVMLMLPGLALFYGGMVRRKNVLATVMQSMAALAVVGVYWVAVGYALAFGPSAIKVDATFLGEDVKDAGLIGWSPQLFFMSGIPADMTMPGLTIPVYLHMIFQGMFAIITPALISGAIAERIRFWPFCIFMILWVTFVYCPLAHMVWAFDNFDLTVAEADRGSNAIGLLGKMGALDFAGGTVVHIAAGLAGLACCVYLGKRDGYPKTIAHPNSMVLTLLGAGLLWFGWFGFNGGSAVASNTSAASAFAATQAAAAAAGLGWLIVEWLHKGKPTALGLASGIVAGLVAVTPAAGFVAVWGGLAIGFAAAVICYLAVLAKGVLGYDDSLDAFGVHGVGGFIGAVLTGVFAFADNGGLILTGESGQTLIQLKAALLSVGFAFIASLILCALVQAITLGNFRTSKKDETIGLDQTEHGEIGFDFGYATQSATVMGGAEPRSALAPKPDGRFSLTVDGATHPELMKVWTALCQPSDKPADPDFLAVYPYVTTVSGSTFKCRGGNSAAVAKRLDSLFKKHLPGKTVKVNPA